MEGRLRNDPRVGIAPSTWRGRPTGPPLRGIVDAVLPIELEDVQRARRLVATSSLQARDAIHAAVMQRHDIGGILTFDRAFDEIPGVTRLG